MTIYYLDLENGNDANPGTSFANRKKTSGALTLAAGDELRVMGSADPIDTGKTFTGVYQNKALTLSSAVTQLIDDCESAFTASTNITATASGARKSGSNSCSLAVAAGFTTGKMAYKSLAGTLDLSGYEQITFWLLTNAAMGSASTLRVDLCSDATGDVPVDQFTIARALNDTNVWIPITINKGSALGNSIASISIHALIDPGTPTILFDNFTACKAASAADCLTLHTLISHAASGSFQSIQSFNGTTVNLDASVSITEAAATNRGFYLPTAAGYTLYKVNPIVPTTYSTSAHRISFAGGGSSAQDATVSFGWDRTAMTTQNLKTWIHCNSAGGGINFAATNDFITLTGEVGFIGAGNTSGIASPPQSLTFSGNVHCNNNSGNGFSYNAPLVIGQRGTTFSGNLTCIGNGGIGLSITGTHPVTFSGNVSIYSGGGTGIAQTAGQTTFTGTVISQNNGNPGVNITGDYTRFNVLTCQNNNSTGLSIGATTGNGDVWINDYSSISNGGTTAIFCGAGRLVINKISAASGQTNTFGDTRGVTIAKNVTSTNTNIINAMDTSSETGKISLFNVNGDGNLQQRGYGYNVAHDSVTTPNGTGKSIKIQPTQVIRGTSDFPGFFRVGVFNVKANTQFTITGRVRTDNAEITCRLRVPGGQLSGLDNDITDTSTAAAINAAQGSWEELSVSGTATETGTIEVLFEAWGGTTRSAWLGEITGP